MAHEIRSEIECKVLCLKRTSEYGIQELLKFLSVNSDIALNAGVASSPGKSLSVILNDYKDISLQITALTYEDNKKKFFSSDKTFETNIDIGKLDTTPICKILKKIPAYATCKNKYVSKHSKLIHSGKVGCKYDAACCSLCMKCRACIGLCEFSKISLKELENLRNIDSHNTVEEFEEISVSMDKTPKSKLADEWEKKLLTWKNAIIEILELLSVRNLDPQISEREKLKLNNVLMFKKECYLPCCFPNENILSLIYRNTYSHTLTVKLEISRDAWEKVKSVRYLRSKKSKSVRKDFECRAVEVLSTVLDKDINANVIGVEFSQESSTDVISTFRIESKEKDIPKKYQNMNSPEAESLMGSFEYALADVLMETFSPSQLNVSCIGYKFSSITMHFSISGAETNIERDMIKAKLNSLINGNYFEGILDTCHLKGCKITLTLPSESKLKFLKVEFRIISYKKEVHEETETLKPLITQKLGDMCKAVISNFEPNVEEDPIMKKHSEEHFTEVLPYGRMDLSSKLESGKTDDIDITKLEISQRQPPSGDLKTTVLLYGKMDLSSNLESEKTDDVDITKLEISKRQPPFGDQKTTEVAMPSLDQPLSHASCSLSSETAGKTEIAYENICITNMKPNLLTYTAHKKLYQQVVREQPLSPSEIEIVCSGQMLPTIMKFDEYSSQCDEFLKNFLGVKGPTITERHILPPKHWWKNDLADIVKKFEERSRSENLVFITKYELLEHYHALQVDVDKAAKKLDVDLEGLDGESTDRMLVLDVDLNSIYNVWFSASTEEEEVFKSLKKADAYLRLLMYLHGNILFGEEICILNCIAAPNYSNTSGKKQLILDRKILRKKKEFSIWFDEIKRKFSINQTCPVAKQKMKKFLSLLLGSIATKVVDSSILSRQNVIR